MSIINTMGIGGGGGIPKLTNFETVSLSGSSTKTTSRTGTGILLLKVEAKSTSNISSVVVDGVTVDKSGFQTWFGSGAGEYCVYYIPFATSIQIATYNTLTAYFRFY